MKDAAFSRRLRILRDAAKRLGHSGPHSTYQPSYTLPFQRWYKFKEAFSPDIVLESIQRCGFRPRRICDPFGGSGTTALTAQHLGLSSTIIELNPFLADVIRAKTRRYNRATLEKHFHNVLANANVDVGDKLRALIKNCPETLVEPGNGRFVFRKAVARRILQLHESIVRNASAQYRPLLTTMLAACLVSVSNVVINGKGRRYRRHWDEYLPSPRDLDELLEAQFKMVCDDLRYQSSFGNCEVLEGDARTRISKVPDDVDFAIFSPPYPNSFDYTDIYNLELWMLSYLITRDDNTKLRQRTLRSHVQVKHGPPYQDVQSTLLAKTIRQMKSAERIWNNRLPAMINDYFADLALIVESLGERMRRGGRITCVVGDSIYGGVAVDVPGILCDMRFSPRIRIERCETLRIMRASAQHNWSPTLKESLLDFVVTG